MDELMTLLALLNTSSSGKKTASNAGAQINFLTDPWVGVLAGGYDPLAGVEEAPARPLFDQIANDPDAPEAIGSVARAIAEGQPLYKVNRLIEEIQDTGGYRADELKAIANDLAQENEAYQKAVSKPKSDMFTKAGLPAYTERYSDRPELAPLDVGTRSAMEQLLAQSEALRGKASSGRATAGREAAAQERKYKKDVASGPDIEYSQNLSQYDTKSWKNPMNWLSNVAGVATREVSRTAEDILGMSKKPGPGAKPKTFNKNWGDLSDPEVRKRYLASVFAEQEANRLTKKAADLQGKAISSAEAQGRTPLMDMLASRLLASRMIGS